MNNFDDLFAPQPEQYGEVPFDKDAWAAKKQQERDEVFAMIDEYAAKMGGIGDLFQVYLDVQSRFPRYSVSNAILIAAQCPEATMLADFNHWKERGISVKRGEDSIRILESGKEYKRDDGSVGVSYDVKKVFDISQTKSRQRAVPVMKRDDRLLLKALMSNAPCRFAISDELPEGVNVAYNNETNTIQVRQGLDAPTIFQGLAQELAYVHMTRGDYPCKNPGFVLYSVSYMLCQRNGVSAEHFSFAAMPGEYSQLDVKDLRNELSTIRDLAGEISGGMNRYFAEQSKAKEGHDPKTR